MRRYTAKELWEIARADPSRLTPAAGLRPVFQDLVLPTAGFVVGPNELRYVAELSGVYARYGLAMPALFLRAFGVVVEPPVRRILEKYRLDPWAFVDEGRRPSSGRRRPGWPLFAPSGTGWRGFAGGLPACGGGGGPGAQPRPAPPAFPGPGWGEAERLRRKLLAAQAARDEVLARHLGRLKVHLLPFGLPQERVYPYAMYALRHGEALRRLAEAPWEGRVALYLG